MDSQIPNHICHRLSSHLYTVQCIFVQPSSINSQLINISIHQSCTNVFVIWAVNLYNHSIPPFAGKVHTGKWPSSEVALLLPPLSPPLSLSSLFLCLRAVFFLKTPCLGDTKLSKVSYPGTG